MSEALRFEEPVSSASRRMRGLDALAYLLALAAFFPAAGLVAMFGTFAYLWQYGPRSPEGYTTGRRFIFEFFASPLPAFVLLFDFLAIGAAGAAFAIAFGRSRRAGFKLKAAARRLAILVLSLAALVLLIILAMAVYRFGF